METDSVQKQLKDLWIQLSPHIRDNKLIEHIEKLVVDIDNKYEALDELFEVLCFCITGMISDNAAPQSLGIKNFNIGKLNRDLLLHYRNIYTQKRAELFADIKDAEDIFPDCDQLFKQYNLTFLLPDDKIVSAEDVKVSPSHLININIKNCRNMIFNMIPLIDLNYIKANYSDIGPTSGINAKIIERFKNMIAYELPKKGKSDYVLDSKEGDIYQLLDDHNYRKLSDFPSNDFVRNYDYINANIAVANWENKRIMMLKKPIQKDKNDRILTDGALGKMKNAIRERKTSVSDAIFNALYNANMSDEETMRIMAASYTQADNMPRNIKSSQIDLYFNMRNMASKI